MMNEDNERTLVRTRRMALQTAPNSNPEHGVNVLPVGMRLGEFEILDLIGEGGFGIVYLAYDHSLERRVALKEYMPSGLATRTTKMAVTVRSQHNASTFTAGLKSFVNEAKMLAQFDSPALVKVHRFWEGNGTAYMVMPFYEGITLKQAFKEHRITPTENWIRLLLADLFDAIDTIHRAQCFHRDIAPDNILLLKDGRPLLLDFGAARRVIGDLTQCLTVILKPGFAPIEQYADIAGLRQGAWTDIYALAAVVYYLIAGKAPPPAVARMVHDEMVPAREAGKGRYSDTFLAVLDKALSVKPEQRFRSIAELRRALDIMQTVPRTLPATATRRSVRGDPTIPMANVKPSAKPEAKPNVKPEVKPSAKPEIKPNIKPETRSTIKPTTEQETKTEVRPEVKPDVKPSLHTAAAPNRYWQQPRDTDNSAWSRLGRGKPEWLILGLLLSAGIASGIYLGTNRSWNESSEQTPAYGNSAAADSSGASEVPDQEAPDQEVTPAPAAKAAPSAPQPAAQAPAKPSPPPPAANTASTAAAANEASTPKPEREQSAPPAPRPPSERELWRIARTTDKSSAYENYLSEYPKGRHAAAARQRLEEKQPKIAMIPPQDVAPPSPPQQATPKAEPSAAAPSPEEELWNTATALNEAPAFEAYLNKYPNGRYAPLAKDKLASIQPKEPPAAAQPQAPEAAPAEPDAPSAGTDKQASIKPPPEPGAPSMSKQTAPEATPKPAPEPPLASGKKTIKLDNQTMTGDFSVDPKTGIVSGTGKIVWVDGNQFEGTLVRGSKEGKGKFIWNNGQRYSGDWARDMPNGKGTLIFADGSRYEGEVKDGMPHGQGITRFKSGDVYNGAWVKGKSHGHGRYTWTDKSYWEGEFRDDKRTENGKMVMAESAQGAAASAAPPATGETPPPERSAAGKEAVAQ